MPATPKKATSPSTPPVLTAPVPIVAYEDQLLSRANTARWIGVTVDCMGVWARQKPPRGPRALRAGRSWRYRIGDILRWLESQADEPAAPSGRSAEKPLAVKKTA